MTPFSQAATQASTSRGQNTTGSMMPDPNSCKTTFCVYNHKQFGLFWSITLSLNCFALFNSMLLFGYMLAQSDDRIFDWAEAKIGILGLPVVMTLAGTATFMASLVYSAGVYYDVDAFVAVVDAVYYWGLW